MKSLLRNTVVHAFSLFAVSQLFSGVKVLGGLQIFIVGGFVLSTMSFIVRPVLNILTLPLNMITFGAFSFLTNALILYLLTILIPQISIHPFVFEGVSFAGFTIPRIAFNLFFAYVASAFVLSIIISIIKWLID